MARSSHTYSFGSNTSRSNQNMNARRFNYSTVVLISGNENQAGIKRKKQPEVSTITWQEGKEKHNDNEQ